MSLTISPAACTFQLDDEMRIVTVDAAWSEFAVANGAPELAAPAPIGRTLWSYITDVTTAHVYHEVFESVRRTGLPLVFPIRCDAPGVLRLLDLRISRLQPGGLEISSAVVRIERRPGVPLLDRGVPRDPGEMLRVCSWCKNVETDRGWRSVEEATVTLGLFEREALPEITHGMCPACYDAMTALLERR